MLAEDAKSEEHEGGNSHFEEAEHMLCSKKSILGWGSEI
jgi:hypothetical protein